MVGGEIRRQRPAVIVGNDVANRFLNRVQVVPLTRKIERLYPSEASVMLQGSQHKAMANQLATVGKSRVVERLGQLDLADIARIENVIRVQLGPGSA
ncbi:MAG: type II toxin-antitoxin system PemK/MazF family toxin [Rubrobacteraceae bacterium]